MGDKEREFRQIMKMLGFDVRDDLADTPCPGCGEKRLSTLVDEREHVAAARCAACGWDLEVERERCPDCDGAGTVPELLVARGASKRGTVPCPRCGGEGSDGA